MAVFAWVKANGWRKPAAVIYHDGVKSPSKDNTQVVIAEHTLSFEELSESLTVLSAKYPCPANWHEIEGTRK